MKIRKINFKEIISNNTSYVIQKTQYIRRITSNTFSFSFSPSSSSSSSSYFSFVFLLSFFLSLFLSLSLSLSPICVARLVFNTALYVPACLSPCGSVSLCVHLSLSLSLSLLLSMSLDLSLHALRPPTQKRRAVGPCINT